VLYLKKSVLGQCGLTKMRSYTPTYVDRIVNVTLAVQTDFDRQLQRDRYEIGCQLLLITNRKSHTGFRLVPTLKHRSTELNPVSPHRPPVKELQLCAMNVDSVLCSLLNARH